VVAGSGRGGWRQPMALAAFLTTGFLLKSISNLAFGVALIEPIGDFPGTAHAWNKAILFATSGLAGATLAVLVASYLPARRVEPPLLRSPGLSSAILGLLILILVAAVPLYVANYMFSILRIGHQPSFALSSAVYGIFAFAVSWGILLASLSLTLWLIDLGRLPYAALVYVATTVGFMASFTMSSRIQFLLHLLAAAAVIANRRSSITRWRGLLVASCFAAAAFAVSLAAVTVERIVDFEVLLPPVQPVSPTTEPLSAPDRPAAVPANADALAQSPSPTPAASSSFLRKLQVFNLMELPLYELRSLAIMRWIGLEGVMVSTGKEVRLGSTLFVQALAEEPSAGMSGIYQRMGDKYRKVQNFTFLTMPGVIGLASYSDSHVAIAAVTFLIVLLGHCAEKFALAVTRNAAAAAVTGVSLAYLTAQLNVPWTLFIFVIELLLALTALGALWIGLNLLLRQPIGGARVLPLPEST
jgi:hypothetical protein